MSLMQRIKEHEDDVLVLSINTCLYCGQVGHSWDDQEGLYGAGDCPCCAEPMVDGHCAHPEKCAVPQHRRDEGWMYCI